MPLQLLPLFEFPRPGCAVLLTLLLQLNVRELEQGPAACTRHGRKTSRAGTAACAFLSQ